jgi:branched-subunit amino acid aminotransferase/4-amino-4-deoxychorismate lyase
VATLDGVPVEPAALQALALVNYGHFTSMRVEAGAVRGLTLHLQRLVGDCRRLFDSELDPDRVRSVVRAAIGGTEEPIVARVTVFDPDLQMGQPGTEPRPRILVTARAAPPPAPGVSGVRLHSTVFARDLPEVKHVGLMGSLHQRRLAQRAGADDVLFTSPDGQISEVATSNIGFVQGERLIWPDAPWLPGVTMALINQTPGVDIGREPVTLTRLSDFDAAFVTNAATGIRLVRAIDHLSWPDDEPAVLETVRKHYAEVAAEHL